jgi:ribosomal protein S21
MAYNRQQKHRNQSDTNSRNHDSKKPHFKKRKKLTREDFQVPGCARAVRVPDGDIGQALKRFKKMMKMTGIIDEFKDRRRYEKPSKAKYEARKRVAAITSMNDIRNIKRESKEVWVAIIDGKAQ